MECHFILEGILTIFLVINPLQYVGTSRDGLDAIQVHEHSLHALLSQKAMRNAWDGERWHKGEYNRENMLSETWQFSWRKTQTNQLL